MDSVNARPAVAAPPPPPDAERAPQAATTELAPQLSVSASKEAGSTGEENRDLQQRSQEAAPVSGATQKRLSLDAETQSVILRKMDTDTGELLAQYPNDTQLGFRSYARELTEQTAAFNKTA